MIKIVKILCRKFKLVIINPKILIVKALYILSPVINDELYLRILFRLKLGYSLNLSNPLTYNEKLQWLKLNYRNPIMQTLVDKYEAKGFIREKVGSKHVIRTFGVWDCFDDIDFESLPTQFVLKTTHDQGGVVIVKDKLTMNLEAIRKKFRKHQKNNIFWRYREWPYKLIKPRIIAEELLVNVDGEDLVDYKFYCFNGVPKVMYIASGRSTGSCSFDYYDMDFNHLPVSRPQYPNSKRKFSKPEAWSKMIELATLLSSKMPHVRVDFYLIGNNIFVGELTFFQGGGMMPFVPSEWDYILGDFITLPSRNV